LKLLALFWDITTESLFRVKLAVYLLFYLFIAYIEECYDRAGLPNIELAGRFNEDFLFDFYSLPLKSSFLFIKLYSFF
jgi:hypothetical protein